MITEQDLQAAIAECLGERNPNANTCIKLAAFYTIQRQLYGNPEDLSAPEPPSYSFAAAPPEEVEKTIDYFSDTEFGRLIDGRRASEVWPVVDELVSEALRAINPRLYDAFMQKLK